MLDLHTHSTASDGSASPTEIVERAARSGIRRLALTDHDTVAGLDEARAAGASLGVEIVAGVELSTTEGARSLHVLAYYFDEHHPALVDCLERLGGGREHRNRSMASRLSELGLPIVYEEVASLAEGTVGRPHFAQYMVDRGYVQTHEEAFRRWIGDGRPGHIEKDVVGPADAIEAVHRAGGVAVLAHPLVYGSDPAQVERLLIRLRGLGLDGVEVHYATHSPGQVDMLTCFANRHGLLPSGGSDFHRDPWPAGPDLPLELADALERRALRWREAASA